ncbi:hypothetical protein LCGC14_0810750 [marine sediment metagenome]|uniref:C1q domain-containing protein n=1 Tax=marine sediment metagenome TaxID=412755 RepID=A0A0F9S6Q2_9ZZZZ
MALRRDAFEALKPRSVDDELKRSDAASLSGVPLLRFGVFCAAKISRTGVQTIPEVADTKILFNVVEYDNYAVETNSQELMAVIGGSAGITVQRAGIYMVCARALWDGDGTADGVVRQLSIRKNTAFIARDQTWIGAGNALNVPTNRIAEPFALVRGDLIEAYVFHDRDPNASLGLVSEGESSFLSVHWVALG